jgi:hypothetical protein
MEIANNNLNQIVTIDEVLRLSKGYTCIHCNCEVQPKKGVKNAFHFAHIGATECSMAHKYANFFPKPETDILTDAYKYAVIKRLRNEVFCQNKMNEAQIQVDKRTPKYSVDTDNKTFVTIRLTDCFDSSHTKKLSAMKFKYDTWDKTWTGDMTTAKGLGINSALAVQKVLRQVEGIMVAVDEVRNKLSVAQQDFQNIEAERQAVLSWHLYLLKIVKNGKTFYKIGKTCRTVQERITEIKTQIQAEDITVCAFYKGLGFVEAFVKQEIKNNKILYQPYKTATEYFECELQYITALKTLFSQICLFTFQYEKFVEQQNTKYAGTYFKDQRFGGKMIKIIGFDEQTGFINIESIKWYCRNNEPKQVYGIVEFKNKLIEEECQNLGKISGYVEKLVLLQQEIEKAVSGCETIEKYEALNALITKLNL